jgi:polyhydroxyalkanoate synthesis repressor PhaR
MRLIKKYANRKLYDTTDKGYITMEKLSDLIKNGEEVKIIDNKSKDDITASVVSQLLARENNEDKKEVPSGILVQLLRRGGDYAKKTMNMAEDEIDKIVNILVKDRQLSESDENTVKKHMVSFSENAKNWIKESVDKRVNEALDKMNLATKKQMNQLIDKMDQLSRKIEWLEKLQAEKKSAAQAPKIDSVQPPGDLKK